MNAQVLQKKILEADDNLKRLPVWHFVPPSQLEKLHIHPIHQQLTPDLNLAPESAWWTMQQQEKDPLALKPLMQEHSVLLPLQATQNLPAQGMLHYVQQVPAQQKASLQLRWESSATETTWANHRIDIFLEEDSECLLTLNSLQKATQPQLLHLRVWQQKGSRLIGVMAEQGGLFRRLGFRSHLRGEGAHFELRGFHLGREQEQLHLYGEVHHDARACTSQQFFRSVLLDQSRFSCDSLVHIPAQVTESSGHQLINSLLLSPHAKAMAKPTLLIYNDHTEATHGSTCGSLDPVDLFYLMSRGISPSQARSILMRSFAAEIFQNLPLGMKIQSMQTSLMQQLSNL